MSKYYYKHGLFGAGISILVYVIFTVLLSQTIESAVISTIILDLSIFLFYLAVRYSDKQSVLLTDDVVSDFNSDLSFKFPIVLILLIRIMTLTFMFAFPFLLQSPIFEEYTSAMSECPDFVSVFLALILAPIGEEALMRGLIFSFLRNSIGTSASVVITSFLFAVLHPTPLHFIMTFCLSVVLCYVYMLTNSFALIVCFHSFFNMTGYLVMSLEMSQAAIVIFAVISFVLVILALLFYTAFIRKRLSACRMYRLPYIDIRWYSVV